MKYLSLLFFVALLVAGCKKDDNQAEVDENIIVEYLASNDLEATRDNTGLYYIIYDEGSGGHPDISSTVEVMYKGYLIDSTVFDQTSPGTSATFPLANLIAGWQIGIPKLQKGGNGLFLLPSALGYGSQALPGIPANSVLIFEITLVDF